MSKEEIDKWLRKWDEEGCIDVCLDSDTYDEMLDDFVKAGVKNPFDLMMIILSVLNG